MERDRCLRWHTLFTGLPVRVPFLGKIVLYIEYHIRAANDVSFTGCSTVYSFVPISQVAERLSIRHWVKRDFREDFYLGGLFSVRFLKAPFVGVEWHRMYGIVSFFPTRFENVPSEEERKAKVSSRFDAINIINPVLTLKEPLLWRS